MADPIQILVVEDDPDVQLLLTKQLKAAGYLVTVASDGLDALVKLEQLRPRLIVCDVMMPNLDGFELIKALRGNAGTQEIPLIFLTAKTDPRSKIEGISSGARFYINKPFTMEDLINKVRKALSET
jgi:DNA-binding response OmpR family regulator